MAGKSVLVIDTPNNCSECPCCNENVCGNQYKGYIDDYLEWNSGRPSWCPLKDLPQKLDANDWHRMFSGKYDIREAKGYGWNVCLDVITGETE